MYKKNQEMAQGYDIGDFSPMDLKGITGGCIALIGSTGSGKTILLKDILSHTKENYDKIYLMSRTAKLQSAYDFIPRAWITDDYSEELTAEIWNQQVRDFESGGIAKVKNVLIILDDIIASPEYRSSKMINEIATGARHLKITLIVLSQYFTAIKPLVRANLRIAITFAMPSKKERDKFVNQFLSADNQIVGEMLLRRVTEGYQCLIVENYKCGAKIEECVKKYTANPKAVVKFKEDQITKNKIRKITLK